MFLKNVLNTIIVHTYIYMCTGLRRYELRYLIFDIKVDRVKEKIMSPANSSCNISMYFTLVANHVALEKKSFALERKSFLLLRVPQFEIQNVVMGLHALAPQTSLILFSSVIVFIITSTPLGFTTDLLSD